MASESKKKGTWNLGFGSNMNVKNVTEKKLVPVLGKYIFYSVDIQNSANFFNRSHTSYPEKLSP